MKKTKLIFTRENLIEKVKEIEKKHKGLACQIEIKIMNGPKPEISKYGDLGYREIKVVPIKESVIINNLTRQYKDNSRELLKSDLGKIRGKHESLKEFEDSFKYLHTYLEYFVKEEGVFLFGKYGGGKVANIVYERLK